VKHHVSDSFNQNEHLWEAEFPKPPSFIEVGVLQMVE